jgi:hypothetical protein
MLKGVVPVGGLPPLRADVKESIKAAMSALNLGFSTGSAGNQPASSTDEKSDKAKTRAAKAQRKTLEQKERDEERRILKRHSAELRLANQSYRRLPGDSYDSYNGIWRPPEERTYFDAGHVFHPVLSSGSHPASMGVVQLVVADYPMEKPADVGQHLKLMQQGLLDTERSLTQLHKVDVAPDSREAAHHEKPQGVCCTILPKGIEIYNKPMHDTRTILRGATCHVHQCTIIANNNIKRFPFVSVNILGVGSVIE